MKNFRMILVAAIALMLNTASPAIASYNGPTPFPVTAGGTGSKTGGGALDNLTGATTLLTSNPQTIVRSSPTNYQLQDQYYLNIDPVHLPNLSNCMSKAATNFGSNAGGNCLLLYVGDSTTAGLGANNAGSGSTSVSLSAPTRLAQALSLDGIATSWQGFMGDACCGSYQSNYDGRLTLGSNWYQDPATDFSVGGDPYFAFANTANNYLQFTPTDPEDHFVVFYQTGSTNCTFSLDIDGGTATNVNSAGSAGVASVTIAANAVGNHTSRISWVSGGNCHIMGEYAYNSAKVTLNVLNAGWIGSNSGQWASTNSAISAANAIAAMAPTVTFINLGINDWANSISVANYTTNMQTIITKAKLSGDVVIVSPDPSNFATYTQALQKGYVDVMRNLAISNNIGFIDNWSYFGSYSSTANTGLYYDGIHLNTGGYNKFGGSEARVLTAGLQAPKTINTAPITTTNLNVVGGQIQLNGNGVVTQPGNTNSNIAIGVIACANTAGAVNDTCIGTQAGNQISYGYADTLIGTQAGAQINTANTDTCIGTFSCAQLQGGNSNTAIGAQALAQNTSGFNGAGNTDIGQYSMVAVTGSAANNTGIGVNNATTLTSGSNNTFIGAAVGSTTLTTGSNNLLIGTSNATDTLAASTSNEINIDGLLFYNVSSRAAPAISACGTSPSIDSHANNRSGTITAGSGTVTSCTMTFSGTGYGSWNHCRLTPHSSLASFAYSYTLTAMTITGTSLTGAVLDYDCDGY